MSKVITIPISDCKHIKEISKYNYNYYKLPYEIEGNDVILEICEEDYDSYTYILGKSSEGDFGKNYNHLFYSCYYGFDKCNDFIILDEELRNVILT